MAQKNRYGLGRTIPESVRREIRQRCGFGCVRCGTAIYDYEHFNPDFVDAKTHDPFGMTLLCPQCNQKRARGMLSAETVALADKNPFCKQRGYASEFFDFGSDPILVKFAGATFVDCDVVIQVQGLDIMSIKPPEQPGAPVRLSGFFADSTGATTLRIRDNAWSAGDDNWDVEVKGPVITVRRGAGDIALRIRAVPPREIHIEKLEMLIEDYYISGDKDALEFSVGGRKVTNFNGVNIVGGRVGIRLD